MPADLKGVIEKIKSRKNDVSSWNEAKTRISAVVPVLRALGWDAADDELEPEYKIAAYRDRYVDIALLSEGGLLVFVEIKAPEKFDVEENKKQLLEYCLLENVKIGVLTNGLQWRIYYRKSGATKDSYYLEEITDLVDGDVAESAQKLTYLLGRDNVVNKIAFDNAKRLWQGQVLSAQWKKLLGQPNNPFVKKLRDEIKKENDGMDVPPDVIREFLMSRAKLSGGSVPAVAPKADKPAVASSPALVSSEVRSQPAENRPGAKVRVKMFGEVCGFASKAQVIPGFIDRACREKGVELKDLEQRLKSDGKQLLMVYSENEPKSARNEKPQPHLFRSTKRIGNTNYWANTHFGFDGMKKACQRVIQALDLPRDSLVWLD